ncbi:MAG: GNAT superfamily N-acetyltransferase [Patiriisocius sp.]|jgi:GNAT superfamily N-acetyltransferase
MIRPLKQPEIRGLNSLSPSEWKFDYELFLQQFINDDFFYAFSISEDERIVGTGNVLVKENVAWFANIIVDENYRGKGLGSKMTKFLVDFVVDKGFETQLLVATHLGEAVYTKIGFRKVSEYLCFDSEVDQDYNYSNSIQALRPSDIENVYNLDRDANDENRIHLIDKYYQNGFGYFGNDRKMLGFYLPEFGQGLVLSRDNQAGIELLKLKHSKKGKRTMLPIENKEGIKFLESMGLRKGDKSSRMIFGKDNKWKPKYIFSYGSGYCG